VKSVLDEILSLRGRASSFTRETRLLGDIVELDSMAIAALITSFEERLGIAVSTDTMDADTFATVGSLTDFVQHELAAG
jgi:acyl carrier protein